MLTRWSPWQLQAVNRIHREIGLDHVYFETNTPEAYLRRKRTLKGKIWDKKGLILRPKILIDRIFMEVKERIEPVCTTWRVRAKEKRKIFGLLFPESWKNVQDSFLSFSFVKERSFNSYDIAKRKVDIIIVFGTSLLPSDIISAPFKACINLHWGLSPFYRGSYCTEWAIINDEIQNIGVTIHQIDEKLDMGPILAQARPNIEVTDSPFSIDMKLSVLGVDLLIEILSEIKRKRCLLSRPQNKSIGKTYYINEWSSKAERLLSRKLSKGKVGPILKHEPKHPIYPIVKLTEVPCEKDISQVFVLGTRFP